MRSEVPSPRRLVKRSTISAGAPGDARTPTAKTSAAAHKAALCLSVPRKAKATSAPKTPPTNTERVIVNAINANVMPPNTRRSQTFSGGVAKTAKWPSSETRSPAAAGYDSITDKRGTCVLNAHPSLTKRAYWEVLSNPGMSNGTTRPTKVVIVTSALAAVAK